MRQLFFTALNLLLNFELPQTPKRVFFAFLGGEIGFQYSPMIWHGFVLLLVQQLKILRFIFNFAHSEMPPSHHALLTNCNATKHPQDIHDLIFEKSVHFIHMSSKYVTLLGSFILISAIFIATIDLIFVAINNFTGRKLKMLMSKKVASVAQIRLTLGSISALALEVLVVSDVSLMEYFNEGSHYLSYFILIGSGDTLQTGLRRVHIRGTGEACNYRHLANWPCILLG